MLLYTVIPETTLSSYLPLNRNFRTFVKTEMVWIFNYLQHLPYLQIFQNNSKICELSRSQSDSSDPKNLQTLLYNNNSVIQQ